MISIIVYVIEKLQAIFVIPTPAYFMPGQAPAGIQNIHNQALDSGSTPDDGYVGLLP
jgi:hypothetical protein